MAAEDENVDGPSIAPPSLGFGLRRRKKAAGAEVEAAPEAAPDHVEVSGPAPAEAEPHPAAPVVGQEPAPAPPIASAEPVAPVTPAEPVAPVAPAEPAEAAASAPVAPAGRPRTIFDAVGPAAPAVPPPHTDRVAHEPGIEPVPAAEPAAAPAPAPAPAPASAPAPAAAPTVEPVLDPTGPEHSPAPPTPQPEPVLDPEPAPAPASDDTPTSLIPGLPDPAPGQGPAAASDVPPSPTALETPAAPAAALWTTSPAGDPVAPADEVSGAAPTRASRLRRGLVPASGGVARGLGALRDRVVPQSDEPVVEPGGPAGDPGYAPAGSHAAATERPARRRPQLSDVRLPAADLPPWLTGPVGAAVVGAVVGLVMVLVTGLVLAGCRVVFGTASCGGGPGFVFLLVIVVLAVVLGALLLRLIGTPEPGSTSTLAIALMAVVVILFLLGSLTSWRSFLVVPVLTAATFALSHWVTAVLAADPDLQ